MSSTIQQARPQGIQRRVTVSEQEQAKLGDIEAVIADCEIALADAGGKIAKAFAMASGIVALREMITDQMMQQHIMPLMNSRLGFKTDKDPNRSVKNKKTGEWEKPNPYPLNVVKECLIEALLRGAYPVNNEFNIISGQAYLTKEYFIRKVKELPGVTDVVASPGIPRQEGGRTLVRFGLSWKVNGIPDCLKDAEGKPGRVFEIKADDYSSTDQILGKATRKAYAAAYQQMTGSEVTLPEGDADEAGIDTTPNVTNGRVESDLAAKAKQVAAKVTTAPAASAPAQQPAAAAESDPIPTPDTPEPDASGAQDEPPVDVVREAMGQEWDAAGKSLREALKEHLEIPTRQSQENVLHMAARKLGAEKADKLTVDQRVTLYNAITSGRLSKVDGTIKAAE